MPFLLRIVCRTELLHAYCIIFSFQQEKNNWPYFIDVRNKGHNPGDMLQKGKVDLLLPEVGPDSLWAMCTGKSYFLQRPPGRKKTQVFGFKP